MFTSYTQTLVPGDVLARFKEVREAIGAIPDNKTPDGNMLSCHLVCRLLSRLTKLPYQDGYFFRIFSHSWLSCKRYIIDPYPVGVLTGPLLLETAYGLPWGGLYSPQWLGVTATDQFANHLAFYAKLMGIEDVKETKVPWGTIPWDQEEHEP